MGSRFELIKVGVGGLGSQIIVFKAYLLPVEIKPLFKFLYLVLTWIFLDGSFMFRDYLNPDPYRNNNKNRIRLWLVILGTFILWELNALIKGVFK